MQTWDIRYPRSA